MRNVLSDGMALNGAIIWRVGQLRSIAEPRNAKALKAAVTSR